MRSQAAAKPAVALNMSGTCIIEINDVGITVADAHSLKLSSPGYAVLDAGELYTGAAAYERARLNPRRTYDRFWSQLDQQPLSRPAGEAQSHADLAYFHLRELWQELASEAEEIIFAVPADFAKPQLALLLGIAQALEMTVTGLIASPVAAAATVAGDAPRLVLDMELHRLTATQVSGGANLQLGSHREISKQGLAGLYDAWANMIAERFVRDTRYDPQHQASAEQKLYARLPQWLDELEGHDHARFELQVAQRSHYVEISVSELQQAAAHIYRPIIETAAAARGASVLLGHRLAALPGLQHVLDERLAAPPVTLTQTAIAESVLAHLEAVRSDAAAPAFVTRLPGAMRGAITPADAAEVEISQPPSHVLCQWQAYPINGAPLVLDAPIPRGLRLGETPQGPVVARHGDHAVLQAGDASVITLNGAPVTGETRLSVGDSIRVGDAPEMRLIALVSGDGPA